MRKILISVLVCLLLIGSVFFMVNGISKFNIEGIKGLDEKNSQVEQKISDLSNVISITFTNTESNLKRTANTLQDTKTGYENQSALSDTQNPSYVSQLEKYDIDYLWTKLGNYARDEKVVIKIELVSGGSSSDLYNLNFTANGEYVNITNFIYDIENDSKLGFKIDEFKMTASGENGGLTATFVCKEIPINVGTIDQATSNGQSGVSDGSSNSGNTAGTTSQATNGTSTSTSTSTSTNSTSNTTSGTSSSNAATSSSTGGTSTTTGTTSTSTSMMGTEYTN